VSLNPAINLESFAIKSQNPAPPPLNALYLRDGKYDGMARNDVAATFARFRSQTATNRLALFFHGGLVDKASGQQSAANEYLAYSAYTFPLFFIWESGAQEVLAHHLPLIFAETIFGRVLSHATSLIESKLPSAMGSAPPGGSAVAAPLALVGAPLSQIVVTSADIDAFMTAIKNDPQIQNEAVAIARGSESVDSLLARGPAASSLSLSPRTMLSPEVVSSVRGAFLQANSDSIGTVESMSALPFSIGGAIQAAWAVAKAAVPVIVNCIRRFVEGRDHGVPCTIVEEILRALYLANFGSAVWEEMKKETEDAFGADSNTFGGTAVVEEICKLVQDKPKTVFTLVGHSTGGVYIGNFLQHVDQALTAQGDTTTAFDIVLMAPANTADFYVATYAKRVRGIRIFQMTDAAEQQDHLLSRDSGPEDPSILGKIYPRSLLYLVSGVCEYFEGHAGSGHRALDGYDMPILGMDRFFALTNTFSSEDYPSLSLIRVEFPSTPAATKYARVLSPTDSSAAPGFRCTSEKHGNFPGDAEMIESMRLCFQNGL
jgi:hypothetical protein